MLVTRLPAASMNTPAMQTAPSGATLGAKGMAFHRHNPPLMTRRQLLLSMLLIGPLAMYGRIAAWLRSADSIMRNGWVLSVDD